MANKLLRSKSNPLRTIRSEKVKARVFTALEKGLTISEAADYARISRQSLYNWRRDEPEFQQQMESIIAGPGSDKLESVALDHAINGVKKPITWQGRVTDEYTEYDHTLLIKMLERRRPTVQKTEVTINNLADRLRDARERVIKATTRPIEAEFTAIDDKPVDSPSADPPNA